VNALFLNKKIKTRFNRYFVVEIDYFCLFREENEKSHPLIIQLATHGVRPKSREAISYLFSPLCHAIISGSVLSWQPLPQEIRTGMFLFLFCCKCFTTCKNLSTS